MTTVAEFTRQYLLNCDSAANHNVQVVRIPMKSGATVFSVEGAQTADWLKLAADLQSGFGASLRQRSGRWMINVPNRKSSVYAWAVLVLAAVGIALCVYSNGGVDLKSLGVAVASGIASRSLWSLAAQQGHRIQMWFSSNSSSRKL